MAQQDQQSELEALAFEIYSKRVAIGPTKRSGEEEAVDAYRKADAFLSVRKKIRAGELKPKPSESSQLANCCAPNLPRSHPLNLVAQTYTDRKVGGAQSQGDINKVRRIYAWLEKNPEQPNNPDAIVPRLNREFPDLSWTAHEIATAREVFPAYCSSN